jgi:DNA-binding transcriptional ArsR family regulator
VVEHRQSAELNNIFSALADPTRRAILQGLAKQPATINQIAEPFPVSLNAISKHVMVLERAGFVRREIKGREHYCWIDPRPLRDAEQWLEEHRRFWEQRMDGLERYVAKKFKASKFKASKRRTHGKPR